MVSLGFEPWAAGVEGWKAQLIQLAHNLSTCILGSLNQGPNQ